MIPATPAQQRRLLDLQHIDTTIRRLEHRRAHLPEQKAVDENVDTLRRVNAEYATGRDTLDRLELQQRRHENELAAVDSRRRSEEGRMYSGLITSEKELEALRSELSSLRARKGSLEDALLDVMGQREDLESLAATLQERHAELTGMVDELAAARDAAATDIDAELAEARARRQSLAADLPDEMLASYEELRARKDGVGVAELQGRTCMGCRLQLTAIELEELREDAQRGLARCAQCSRILVPVG